MDGDGDGDVPPDDDIFRRVMMGEMDPGTPPGRFDFDFDFYGGGVRREATNWRWPRISKLNQKITKR